MCRRPDADDFRLRHLLESEPDPFAAEAAVLEATEGHRVQPVVRRIVDHDPVGLQRIDRAEGRLKVVGEDARMEAVVGPVGQGQRFVEAVEALKESGAMSSTVPTTLPSNGLQT
jgi:hypothetical protein